MTVDVRLAKLEKEIQRLNTLVLGARRAAGGAAAHNILSITHSDSNPAALIRGDLLRVDASPDLTRLAIGAMGDFVRSDGVDPGWARIIAGDLPAHAALHELGGGDQVDHDDLLNFVANEHIDYTLAIDNTSHVVKTSIKCRAYLNNVQNNIPDGVWTTVALDAETFDPGNDFNLVTSQYTTPVAGYYLVVGSIYFSDTTADKRYGTRIYNVTDAKSEAISFYVIGSLVTTYIIPCVGITYIGAAKVLELQAYQNTGAAAVDLASGDPMTSFGIHLLST